MSQSSGNAGLIVSWRLSRSECFGFQISTSVIFELPPTSNAARGLRHPPFIALWSKGRPVDSLTSSCTFTTMSLPHETLYLRNIDWKVKKEQLKRALFMLFTRHGKVLEVVALRKDGLRGQAFVVMESTAAATKAMQAEQGLVFFGKELMIEYARTPNRVLLGGGAPPPKKKRKLDEEAEDTTDEAGDKQPEQSAAADQQTPPAAPAIDTSQAPPSKFLLAQNLPSECNQLMLQMLFRQYQGFVDVRLPRPGLAFVEFDDEPHATVALEGLNGFQLSTTDTLQLGYGKE